MIRIKEIKEKLDNSKYFNYKSRFIYSILITVFFALFNAFLGIYYLSIWYGSIAIYFITLALLRAYVFIHAETLSKLKINNCEQAKAKIFFISGIVVILLVVALSFSVIQMVSSSKPVVAGMVVAIANAGYAFYKITLAIINLTKAKKIHDNVNSTIRCIFFVDSLVSMLSLTVTMLSTFNNSPNSKYMIIGVSTCVSILIIITGVYMIINGVKRIKSNCK